MADFSSTEKTNASWKHLFGLLPTSNADGAEGRFWYEEQLPATHIIVPTDLWSDTVPNATTKAAAQAAAGPIVEDRSSGETVTLVSAGSDWDISPSGIIPKVGFQVSDVHPNASYVKSVTNVVNLGGGTYRITLNDNTGVSAGSAVLNSRIYLTEDITSNGLGWFARSVVGNHFSGLIENFIQPQRFGQGYTVRIFQGDGTEIYTTQGAWIFNWQKGLLLLANGHTADDEGYTKPLYIEGFRYTGSFGVGDALPSGTLHDTLRYDGANWVTNSTLQADGSNVTVENKLTVSGNLVVPSGSIPTSSSDPGVEGEIRQDDKFLYRYFAGKWRRTEFAIF